MAVISSLRSVQAEIRVNGQRATEYVDSAQRDTDCTTIRYIEAVSDANFTIHCTMKNVRTLKRRDIRLTAKVDGMLVRRSILRHEEHKKEKAVIRVLGYDLVQGGVFSLAPLAFAELTVDEHEPAVSTEKVQEKVNSLGEIHIELERGQVRRIPSKNISISLDAIEKVHEKDLKGRSLSHQAKIKESRPVVPWTNYSFTRDSDGLGPFATFIFRYRSRAALQAEGIIPRTPSPTPLESRPVEELNPNELRELVQRQKEQIAASSAIKREIKSEIKPEDNAGTSRSKRAHDQSEVEVVEARLVKRERTSGSAPVIIDLSDD